MPSASLSLSLTHPLSLGPAALVPAWQHQPSHHPVLLRPLPLVWQYTRWSWALQPAWYSAGKANKLSHKVFAPVKAAAWGLFGAIFTAQTSTPGVCLCATVSV